MSAGAHHIAVVEFAEVELHPRLEAPFERHLVDGDGPLAAVHRRVVVPRRVDMGAVMGRKPDPLDRPALAIRQLLGLQPGEERAETFGGVRVGLVFDLGLEARRVRPDARFERNRDVDETARHGFLPECDTRCRLGFSPVAQKCGAAAGA